MDRQLINYLLSNTSLDGSVKISKEKFKSKFFEFEKNFLINKNGSNMNRGYNYISAIDSSLTSIQKVNIHYDVIVSATESLKVGNLEKLEIAILLDNIKNSLITIFNSFVYQEKYGEENTDKSLEYQALRNKIIKYINIVVKSIVDLVWSKDIKSYAQKEFIKYFDNLEKIIDKLKSYHKEFRLPSTYVSRPEASNPLIIFSSGLVMAEKYKDVDMIIGLPSGGTEVSFFVKNLIYKMQNKDVKLNLIPISLHSIKQDNKYSLKEKLGISSILFKDFSLDNVKSLLVCDDNSSTGKTLQYLKDYIHNIDANIDLHFAVAEADITRSLIDKQNDNRTHLAHKNLYDSSINILPVSSFIKPKVDLKEIIEKSRIISYYKDMENKSTNLVDKIFNKTSARINEFGLDYTSFNEENSIQKFSGTFLSNFYSVSVEMKNKIYPSVEHAYQAAKFVKVDWDKLDSELKNKIEGEVKEFLKSKGYAESIEIGEGIFYDRRMNAANIKGIADIYKKYDLVDKDWENKRVKIMIDLLLQKFANPDLKEKLISTLPKTLIEGNDWGDTLWGVVNGKGRNFLGNILMEIRDMD